MLIIDRFLSQLVSTNSFYWVASESWWINKLLNCCRGARCVTTLWSASLQCAAAVLKKTLKACGGFSRVLISFISSPWNNNHSVTQGEPLSRVGGFCFLWPNFCCSVLFALLFLSVTDRLPLPMIGSEFFVNRRRNGSRAQRKKPPIAVSQFIPLVTETWLRPLTDINHGKHAHRRASGVEFIQSAIFYDTINWKKLGSIFTVPSGRGSWTVP